MSVTYKVVAVSAHRIPSLLKECLQQPPNIDYPECWKSIFLMVDSQALYPVSVCQAIYTYYQRLDSLLQAQTHHDPPMFTAHDAHHSKRVSQYSLAVFDQVSQHILPQLMDTMDQALSRWLVVQMAWTHDTGYVKQGVEQYSKCSHAHFSGQDIHQELRPFWRTMLTGLGVELDQIDQMYQWLCQVVCFHNADKNQADPSHQLNALYHTDYHMSVYVNDDHFKMHQSLYVDQFGPGQLEVMPDDHNPKYRVADLSPGDVKKGHIHIGIPYKDVQVIDTGSIDTLFHACLRIGDNMDATADRLHPYQNQLLDQWFESSQGSSAFLVEDLPSPKSLNVLSGPTHAAFYDLLCRYRIQRKYFFGLWILNKVDVTVANRQLELVFQTKPITPAHRSLWTDPEDPAVSKTHIPLTDFFPRRVQSALDAIRIDEQPIKVAVDYPENESNSSKPWIRRPIP